MATQIKKAKFSDWTYKSSYKTRPQIRISKRAYEVLSKSEGSMSENIDKLLGLDLVEEATTK